MSTHEADRKHQWMASGWLRMLFWMLAVVPLGWVVADRSGEILASLQGVRWQELGKPLLQLVLILPLMALNSWVSVKYLGGRFTYFQAAGVYFSSQGPKYLPGGFWAFPSRMVFYRSRGMAGSDSVLSVFREVAALFLGAAAVGALGAAQEIQTPELRVLVLAGTGFSLLAVLLTSTAAFWKVVSRLPLGRSLPFDDLIRDRRKRSLRWLPLTFLVSVIFWVLVGIPFRSLILVLDPSAGLSWLQAASIFSLAWCGGFVVLVVPAGLGVREVLLAALLSGFMPEGTALTVALTARVWWMCTEAVFIGLSLFWLIRTTEFKPFLGRIRGQRKGGQEEGSENHEPE